MAHDDLNPYPALTITLSNQPKCKCFGIFSLLILVTDFYKVEFPLVGIEKMVPIMLK